MISEGGSCDTGVRHDAEIHLQYVQIENSSIFHNIRV